MGNGVCSKLVLVVVILAGLTILLSACGQADEFAGTWRLASQKTARTEQFIIAKVANGYRLAVVFSSATGPWRWIDLTRSGDRLSGHASTSLGPVPLKIVYQPQSGHLVVRTAALPHGTPIKTELVKVSASTAAPAASPL